MVVTLNDDEISDNKSGSDEDGNFIAFIATAIVDESVVPSFEPLVSEIIKQAEVTPPRKIRVDLQESKPKTPNLSKGKLHDKPA